MMKYLETSDIARDNLGHLSVFSGMTDVFVCAGCVKKKLIRDEKYVGGSTWSITSHFYDAANYFLNTYGIDIEVIFWENEQQIDNEYWSKIRAKGLEPKYNYYVFERVFYERK